MKKILITFLLSIIALTGITGTVSAATVYAKSVSNSTQYKNATATLYRIDPDGSKHKYSSRTLYYSLGWPYLGRYGNSWGGVRASAKWKIYTVYNDGTSNWSALFGTGSVYGIGSIDYDR